MNNNDNNIQAENYSRKMEQFLLLLREEVESLSRQYDSDTLSLEELDHYLLAINSFYYRSFQEQFWPSYQKEISEQVNGLLNLKLQESQLSKYVAAIIKRNAHLFNQVKALSNELQDLKKQLFEGILFLQDEIDRQVSELSYSYKELRSRLQELDSFMQELKELVKALQAWPKTENTQFLVMAAGSLGSDPRNSDYHGSYYQLLKQQEQIGDLLNKIQQDDQIRPHRINRLHQQLLEFSPTDEGLLDQFYKHQVQTRALHYIELLILHSQKGNYTRSQELVQEFSDFFAAWLELLHLLITHGQNQALSQLPELYHLSLSHPDYVEELYYDLASTFKTIDSLGQDMDQSPPDFKYFCPELQKMVQLSAPLYRAMAQESSHYPIHLLTYRLQSINGAWELLDRRMKIIAEEYQDTNYLIECNENFMGFLAGQLELLNNIQHDLARLLTPRNLTRVWKDFDIRVTHIPLTPGQILPAPYCYLLDKYNITTRITDRTDNTILEAEGDIFLIRVEDESSEEIPYFIIGKKG